MRREFGDRKEEEGSMQKKFCHCPALGLFSTFPWKTCLTCFKKKKKHLQQLEVMSKGCVAFLFDLHSCRTEQFNLSFPSLPVACGACSA